MLFEAGRISVPYLIKLAPSYGVATREELEGRKALVHDLRTWISHNLDFNEESDRRILKRAGSWMLAVADSSPPRDGTGWGNCFGSLCSEIIALLEDLSRTVELILTDDIDGVHSVEELRRRVDRDWPVQKFDEAVSDAATRFGIRINVAAFREPRLMGWRQYLHTVSPEDDPEESVTRLIERDVYEHSSRVLPITGKDLMAELELEQGPEVGRAFEQAIALYRGGVTDRDELLSALKRVWFREEAHS